MWNVEASMYVRATPEKTCENLSPRSIVEYSGIYEVTKVTRTDSGWTVTASLVEEDIETEFFVEEIQGGYAYELIEGGPFDEMRTTVTVDEEVSATTADRLHGAGPDDTAADPDDFVRVTIASEYAFSGLFSPIYDWLSASSRKQELTLTLQRLAEDIDPSTGDSDDSTSA